MTFAADVEAEELSVFGVVAEDGADGVVGAALLEADTEVFDVAAVDLGSVADLGEVALGLGEEFQKSGLEVGAFGAEEAAGELEHAAGVGDDLHGLNAGDLVEEPAARGVHELGMTLELHELPDNGAFGVGEVAGGVGVEEAVFRGGGAVEDDVNVTVAGGPDVVQQTFGALLGQGSASVRRRGSTTRRYLRRPRPPTPGESGRGTRRSW